MFDCIIPIGQSCNITFLLQNTNIKKETTLFEWFVTPTLDAITELLHKIGTNTDSDILTIKDNHIYMNNSIYSGHYTLDNFKDIYLRRKTRLLKAIQTNTKLLFCRIDTVDDTYTSESIDNFINSILQINPALQDIKLLLIGPRFDFDHPRVIKLICSLEKLDIYSKNTELIELFINKLNEIGYNTTDRSTEVFTDLSEL